MALIRPEGLGLPRGALLCPTGSDLSRGALVRSRGSHICPAGPVLGRIRALSAWAQSQGWHMDPLGPQSEQYSSIGPQSEGPETFSNFRPRRSDQGPAARTRNPKGESGLRRTDQSPQKAKGPARSGPHVTDSSMWDGPGPCRSNQGRGTDQGPVEQIRGAQDETGHRRTRRIGTRGTDQDPPEQTRVPRDEPGPWETNQGLQDPAGRIRARGTNLGSVGLIRALLDYQDPA